MVRKYLDLKPCFNDRMVYPDDVVLDENKFIGLHNFIIYESNFRFGEIENNGIFANFERNSCGNHLILCEGQRIRADHVCNKIHFFGFNSWCMFMDKFIIRTNAGDIPVNIGFSDVGWDVKSVNDTRLEADRRYYDGYGDVFMTCEGYHGVRDQQLSALTYCKSVELGGNRYVEEIVLPDNSLMYIAAITLEQENKTPRGIAVTYDKKE